MGEQKRINRLRNYYLNLDYTYADTKTIKDAEVFFAEDTGDEVYIIPEKNKVCKDEPFEDETIRFFYHRKQEVWYQDFEEDRDFDTKPYGDLFIEFMKENHKNLMDMLILDGDFMEIAEERNIQAKDKIFDLKHELLKSNPYPSQDNLERAKHLGSLDAMAKEIIIHDYVLIKPYIAVYEQMQKIKDDPF